MIVIRAVKEKDSMIADNFETFPDLRSDQRRISKEVS
jgi:hypothetical protein